MEFQDDKEFIKSNLCANLTNSEFEYFLRFCSKLQLDPTMRQIWPVKRWDSVSKTHKLTIQVGIDGYRLIASRTQKYAPGKQTILNGKAMVL